MTLERALEKQLAHVKSRGETFEGYMMHFKPQTMDQAEIVKGWWVADIQFLNVLVRAALLKNSGHNPGNIDVILQNKSFFEQVRTKGVTV